MCLHMYKNDREKYNELAKTAHHGNALNEALNLFKIWSKLFYLLFKSQILY